MATKARTTLTKAQAATVQKFNGYVTEAEKAREGFPAQFALARLHAEGERLYNPSRKPGGEVEVAEVTRIMGSPGLPMLFYGGDEHPAPVAEKVAPPAAPAAPKRTVAKRAASPAKRAVSEVTTDHGTEAAFTVAVDHEDADALVAQIIILEKESDSLELQARWDRWTAAEYYAALADLGKSQQEMADATGKSQKHVSIMIRCWRDRPEKHMFARFTEAYALAQVPEKKRLPSPKATLVAAPPDETDTHHHVPTEEGPGLDLSSLTPVPPPCMVESPAEEEHFLKLSPETVAESKEYFAKLSPEDVLEYLVEHIGYLIEDHPGLGKRIDVSKMEIGDDSPGDPGGWGLHIYVEAGDES